MIDPQPPPVPGFAANQAATDDLRLRLASAQAGERTARDEMRRLARALALTRRLLNFYLGTLPPARPDLAASPTGLATRLWSESLVYYLDACKDQGTHTAISGWAFRPAAGWNARATVIMVLLRHGDTVYATPCQQVRRADVAAFYAGQEPGASGGAAGLDGAGSPPESIGESFCA